MQTLEAIKTRRSIAKVSEHPVEKEKINQLIEMGCWAPTHHKTSPFRFVVFNGNGRSKLQDAWLDGVKREAVDTVSADLDFKLNKLSQKAFRAPTIIMVWAACGRSDKKNPPVWEDHAAVSACLQNMSLAAHDMGLGTIWRSGSITKYPEIQALCKTEVDVFDVERGDAILGFLYVGYPDPSAKIPARTPDAVDVLVSWQE